jgi:hypothetical protein
MARSEGDLRQVRKDAAALKPGALLVNEVWGAACCAIVLGKTGHVGLQFYEILVTPPPGQELRGGVQLWRTKDLLETFKVHNA